ncbi:MAG: carbohydrate-binding domain-containing protein [Eubacteriales bacterium]|nr:carbohydrate-binding domain-containing protein [Eubacteriales bacterium]
MKRRIVSAWLVLMLLSCVPACAWAEESAAPAVLTAENQFTAGDLEPAAPEDATPIVLDDGAADEGAGYTLKDGVLTITDGGSYLLSGEVHNGQILIRAGADDKVRLLLNGLTLTADGCAAIEAAKADKVFITTLEGTENAITVTGAPDSFGKADAALWADCTLTLGGSGSLRVSCPEGHGVKSTDSLKITGGTLTVEAGKRGLSGKDSVRIAGGDVTVVSGTDAVRSTREDAGKLGYIYISGGTVQLTTQGDGFSAEGVIQVDGGEITVKAGERSEAQTSSGTGGKKGWSDADAADDTPSRKGMKADSILIRGGTLALDTADDGLNAASSLTVSGGDVTIATGDDALHSDKQLTISGGRLEITACYEGIEGETILIEGGSIDLTSSDDGINATGSADGFAFGRGRPGEGGSSASLTINGGEVTITAQGDGMDSNGDMTIGGGCVYICGAAASGEVPIDYSGMGVITGGTLLATGSSSHMLQSFGGSSSQPTTVVTLNTQHSAGDTITLQDTEGAVLTSFTPTCSYQLIIVSCPALAEGSVCTLTAGSEQRAMTVGSDTYMAEGGFGRGGFGKGNSGFGRGGHAGDVPPDDDPPPMPDEDGFIPDGFGPGGMPPEGWMEGSIGL